MKHRAMLSAVLLACALPLPNRVQVPQDLRAAIQARLEAVWKKDGAAWSRLTADEFTVVVPEGTLREAVVSIRSAQFAPVLFKQLNWEGPRHVPDVE